MVFEGDKLLFTPGPLNTSLTVKEAMLHDVGSRDVDFIRKVKEIREMILNVAQSTTSGSVSDLYDSVVMQGSGTFSVESVLGTTIAPSDKILILKNGVYGARMCKICERLSIKHTPLNFNDNEAVSVSAVESALKADPAITHVAVVHCETTTGIFNDVTAIGQAVKAFNDKIVFFVDAMSSFGGVELDLIASQIDYLVSSSNKCIQGVPGFGFIIFKKAALEKCKDLARSLALDLYAQWKNLSSTGQFLYTPPTHSLLAFHQALVELEAEGGVKARAARYRQNFSVLVEGMCAIGFTQYAVTEGRAGYIITPFLYPSSSRFDFKEFYTELGEKGFAIYPGKLSKEDTFRIGNIGTLTAINVAALLAAIKEFAQARNLFA